MRFVATPNAVRIRQEVEWATLARVNILISGPAGTGKTAALTEITRNDMKAALLTITPAQKSMRGTLTLVASAFEWHFNRQHVWQIDGILMDLLPDAAKAGHYLIVDEAQLLHFEAQRQLLAYSDAFGLPIIFAGNDYVLKKTRANAVAYDQIESRITKHIRIKGITAGDIDAFCVEFNVEGIDAYELMRRFGTGRNCRDVVNLLEEAVRLAGADRIRLPIIREALHCLHGTGAVKHLFSKQAI